MNKIEETEILEYWFQIINDPKFKNTKIYEEYENYANKEWINYIAEDLEVSDDPLILMNNYLDLLAHKGTIKRKDITAEKKGENIILHMKGKYLPIIRNGKIYAYVLEVALGKFFEYELEKEGTGYVINLHPGKIALRVVLSRRTGKGSIRVSDKDLKKLDMDLIENVTVVPVGKDTGLTEMMFSASNVSPGYVMINVSDASLVGLKEGDKVTIYKRNSDTEEPTIKKEEKIPENKTPENSDSADENPEQENQNKEDDSADESVNKVNQDSQISQDDNKTSSINKSDESQKSSETKNASSASNTTNKSNNPNTSEKPNTANSENISKPNKSDKSKNTTNNTANKAANNAPNKNATKETNKETNNGKMNNGANKDTSKTTSNKNKAKGSNKTNQGLVKENTKNTEKEKNNDDKNNQKGPDEKMMKDFEQKIEQLRKE